MRRYAAIRRDPEARMGGGALCVFVADHGVADEGVSAYPQAVTAEMLRNIAGGGAAVSVLARRLGYRLWIADVGVAADTSADALPGVLYRRIGAGTRNLAREAAMSVSRGARRAGGWRGSRARRGRLRCHADRNRRDGNRQQHLGGGVARGVHAVFGRHAWPGAAPASTRPGCGARSRLSTARSSSIARC